METSSISSKSNQKDPMFVVPPRLEPVVKMFVNHYKASGNSPIIIYGPTGVGKSLFLKVFEILFQRKDDINKNNRPVVWANCAHFGGPNSDPNIARSELFGHMKGAYQNALKNEIGLVHAANGGALILEEIGELPLEVQAMLLTFIEDGIFRRVGSKQNESANVRIVGATNREEGLREDFKYRFFPFYIPALYNRRGDILYYMYAKYPEIVTSLTGSEVLTLLAYNWPGNCREIERVCRIINRYHLIFKDLNLKNREDYKKIEFTYRMVSFDKRETMLTTSRTQKIRDNIEKYGGDVEFLDLFLEQYYLRLSYNFIPVFSDLPTSQDEIAKFYQPIFKAEKSDLGPICKFMSIPKFEEASGGFNLFCAIFGQPVNEDGNIVDVLESARPESFNDVVFMDLSPDEMKRLHSVIRAIMMSQKGVHLGGDDYPESLLDFWNALEGKKKKLDESQNGIDNKPSDEADPLNTIDDLKEKELLKMYYERLLKRSNSNVKMAAEYAGLNPSTFRSKLSKMGVPFQKNRRRTNIAAI
jgi:DNA-binding NtrC family response regulator